MINTVTFHFRVLLHAWWENACDTQIASQNTL